MRASALALVLLAGCVGPSEEEAWRLGGSFLEGYTQEDVEAVCAAAAPQDCILMESEPPQFSFTFPDRDRCEDARERIARVPHVDVRACVLVA